MIDSHAHLIWGSFQGDLDAVIERATRAGVESFIHPCVETVDLPKMISLRQKYPQVFLAGGVHPCHADTWHDTQSVAEIRAVSPEIVAIGETGLDYYHKEIPLEIQEHSFRAQCRLANELKLPVIVHCRDAFAHTLKILKEENVKRGGVMHCYTGNASDAEQYWELGFYLSFSGCLSFKNAQTLRAEAKQIPLERVLIETDSPFLAPQSKRGKRNEPSFIGEVASVLAEIHNVPFTEICDRTKNNTQRLFSLQ